MSWDLVGKALVKECPQDFVDYFAPFTPIHFPLLVASVQTFIAEEEDLEKFLGVF